MSTQETVTETIAAKQQDTIGHFGHGTYSPAMKEVFQDTQRLLGFNCKEAHVTATRFGVDAGQLNKGSIKVSLGKSLNKERMRTLKGTIASVRVNTTWALDIATICVQLDEARKNGLEIVECTINDQLRQFLNDAVSKSQAVE